MAIKRKTGGRKAGTPNKTTKSVKDAILLAYGKMGGNAGLVRWGKENPSEFYKLWAKLLPVQVAGDEENPVKVIHRVERSVVRPPDPDS